MKLLIVVVPDSEELTGLNLPASGLMVVVEDVTFDENVMRRYVTPAVYAIRMRLDERAKVQ